MHLQLIILCYLDYIILYYGLGTGNDASYTYYLDCPGTGKYVISEDYYYYAGGGGGGYTTY